MAITIDLLKNNPHAITKLAEIWYDVLGKIWLPYIAVENVAQLFHNHFNENTLPLTLVAFDNDTPIGMCSLQEEDGVRSDLTPWLASLVVDKNYQKQGVGTLLIEAIKEKARLLGFSKLHLFAFDPVVASYYERLGWHKIGLDHYHKTPIIIMERTLTL